MEKRENSLILETKVTNRSLFSELTIAYADAHLIDEDCIGLEIKTYA